MIPLEIERKFLVRKVLPESEWPIGAIESKSRIVQTYLMSLEPGLTERVRQRSWTDDTVTLTHTIKRHISAGVNEEDEHGISASEYSDLLERRDPAKHAVSKIRTVISWRGFKFEVDTFLGHLKGVILMEVELPSMDTPIELPPFIELEREVTEDGSYSNAALAKRDSALATLIDPDV